MYEFFVTGMATTSFIVGAEWFQFMDEPTYGRSDGEVPAIGKYHHATDPHFRRDRHFYRLSGIVRTRCLHGGQKNKGNRHSENPGRYRSGYPVALWKRIYPPDYHCFRACRAGRMVGDQCLVARLCVPRSIRPRHFCDRLTIHLLCRVSDGWYPEYSGGDCQSGEESEE